MGLNNRYLPSHPASQQCLYALDFANILPLGVTLASGALTVEYNTVPPLPQTDFTVGPVTATGRRLYASLAGGLSGKDYRLTWIGDDSLGNQWPRACLLLCAATS